MKAIVAAGALQKFLEARASGKATHSEMLGLKQMVIAELRTNGRMPDAFAKTASVPVRNVGNVVDFEQARVALGWAHGPSLD